MVKKLTMLSWTLAVLGVLSLNAQEVETQMKSLDVLVYLEQQGNWMELKEAAVAFLDEMAPDDHRAGWAWNKACNGLIYSNELAAYDDLFEKYAEGKFAGNLAFLAACESDFPAYGHIIDNTFKRGYNRGNAGRWAFSAERDRVRLLAMMARMLDKAEDAQWEELPFAFPEQAGLSNSQTIQDLFYLKMAQLLLKGKDSGNSYKLQELTDLETLPDFDTSEGMVSSLSRPPVNEDGSPLFYYIPSSWTAAANDGERLRFVLERAMRSKNNQALRLWADFLCGQFDFLVAEYQFRQEYYQSPAMRDFLYALKDDETIAELVDGTRKITLPKEFNYIEMYKKAGAHFELGEIYASRMQFEKAAEEFKAGGKPEIAENILGAFGRPEAIRTFAAGTEITVPYHFRNAKKLTVKLYRIDSEKAVSQMLEQLKENRATGLLWDVEVFRQEEMKSLRGEKPEKVLTFDLNPLPHHWESTEYLKFGQMESGVFLAEFIPEDNVQSQCDSLIWMTEQALTIQYGAHNGKARIFLNDARSGQPIAKQKIKIYSYYYEYQRRGKERDKITPEVLTFTTDDRGIAEFAGDVFKRPKNSYLAQRIVLSENSIGKLALLSTHEFGIQSEEARPDKNLRTFMITDKTVYKPGDAIAFTGYVRQPSYGGSIQTEGVDKVILKFRDPQHKEAFTKEVPFDKKTQSFTFEMKLPSDAMLGRWSVYGENLFCHTVFAVEEYKKPEYLLMVKPPEKPVKAGEKMPVSIEAKYYFGAPLADAEVRYKVFREETGTTVPFVFAWNWLYGEKYAFCSTHFEDESVQTVNVGRVMVLDAKGKTDVSGRLTFEIDSADAIAKFGERNFRYVIQAEVNDSTNRIVSGSGSVIAAVRPFEVSVYMPWGFAKTGQRSVIQVAARTANGETVKGQGTIQLFRKALNEDGVPVRTGIALTTIPFIPDGPDKPSFILNEEGVYELQAEVVSEDGVRIVKSVPFFVTGEKQGTDLFGEYPLAIATDKPEYQPGDMAQVLVSCNAPNRTVYLIIRSERQAEIQCVTLDGYSKLFTIPVIAEDQPNFFVDVMSYQDGKMLTVQKQLIVPPEKKILNVSAEPAADKVKPGTTLPLKIAVAGLDGKPVAGAVTIAVYDKSLEAINAGAIPQICPFFWNWKRWNELHFRNNYQNWLSMWSAEPGMMLSIEAMFSRHFTGGTGMMGRGRAMMFGAAMKLGAAAPTANGVMMKSMAAAPAPAPMADGVMGAEMDMALDDSVAEEAREESETGDGGNQENTSAVRSNFLDRAFWAGRVDLPENGEMMVELPVPDNLTTWVVRVWSLTPDTRVGEARTELVVSKDLIARLELPRFMTQGDVVNAVISINNTTDEDMEAVTVMLTAPGLLVAPHSQTVAVKANGVASFEVPLKASDVGEYSLILRAESGTESDALELKLPVLVRGLDKQVNACGRLDANHGAATIVLDIPEARREETTAFTLNLSPGAAKNMVELLPYLAADDSGDIFGVVSRFMPALAAKLALQTLGVKWEEAVGGKTDRDALYAEYMQRYCWNGTAVPSFKADDFDKVIAENLRMVKKMVNSDGGWGWFGAYREQSWADTTAYVLDALLELKAAKYGDIDERLIGNGVNWLKSHAKERIVKIKEKNYVSNTDCLVARVLAKAGCPDAELMALCYEHRVHELSPYGLAMLALAYDSQSEESKMLIRNLEQFLKVDDENGTAYLNIPSFCCFFWYGNENETLSAYLELLLREDSHGVLAQKVANYLVTNVRNSPWRNSCRSLGAAVRALARYIVVSGEGQPEFTVAVKMGDETQTFTFNRDNMWSNSGLALFLSADKLATGKTQIELEFSGKGALYWNSMLNYFSLEERMEPAGLEMKIQRNYYRLVQEDASALLAGKKGAAVKENVLKYKRAPLKDGDVVNPGDLIEVELVSTSKNDYDYVVFQDAMPAGFEFDKPVSGWMWQWAAPMYAEYKERGAKFYLRNMARGQSNVFYRIRAQLCGTVTALPARGYGLYAPELKCNGAQQTFLTEAGAK